MAIPSKKEIDFDVYQRQDPASTVDWGKAAKDITTTFEGIRDTRQAKKDAIEKSYQDQQTALQDIGEYDNPTIQQFVMNGGQDAANKEQEFYNLVKRGLAKPADYTMFQHNLKTGFDLVKKNAEQFDNTFKEYTTRVQDGTGAPGEQWIAEQLEGFANMNNMSLQADPETGDMVMLRTDDKGNPIPGESMSVQRMTLLMKQQIDNFDIGKEVLAIKDEMGTVTTTMIRKQYGPNVVITKEMKSRAEEEFFGTKDGNDFLSLKVDQLTSSPYNVQSMIVNGNLTTPNGTKYEVGGEEDYDRWMEENGGDEKNNPYLVMEFGEDNLYKPKFNETQDKAAKEYARAQITGALDYSEEQSVKGLAQTRAATSSEIGLGREKEENFSYVDQGQKIITGTQQEFNEGVATLSTSYNNSEKGKKKPLAKNPVDRNSDKNFILISYEDGDVKKIPRYKLDSSGNPELTSNGDKIPRSQQQQNAEILSYMSPVEGSTDQIYKEYRRANPQGLVDYKGSDTEVKFLGEGEEAIEDTDLTNYPVLIEGKNGMIPAKLSDKLEKIATSAKFDEKQLDLYKTELDAVLSKELKGLNAPYEVTVDDEWGVTNSIYVTIDGTKTQIEFKPKQASKLLSELQKAINAAKTKIRDKRSAIKDKKEAEQKKKQEDKKKGKKPNVG